MLFNIRTHIEIDLIAILRNAKAIKRHTGKRLIAVVKADGYGHGAIQTADAVRYEADMLAVATVEEGIELREAGIHKPILILFTPLLTYAVPIMDNRLITTIDSWHLPKELNLTFPIFKKSMDYQSNLKVHININTGMNRSGVHYTEAVDFINRLKTLPHLQIEGIFTHFATANEADKSFTYLQLERFSALFENFPKNAIKHAANSAASLAISESHYDAVRPGLSLYGIYPGQEKPIQLEPALTWKTYIGWIGSIGAGEGVSYGLTYKATQKILIAGLLVGYGDGYPRSLSGIGEVLINGKRRKIVGQICMDMMVVQLESSDNVYVGSEVVLIGKQGEEEIRLEEVAERAGTIPYEILTGIGKRVNRIYRKIE